MKQEFSFDIGTELVNQNLLDVSLSDLDSCSNQSDKSILVDNEILRSWDLSVPATIKHFSRNAKSKYFAPIRSTYPIMIGLYRRAKDLDIRAMSSLAFCYDHGFILPRMPLMREVWKTFAAGNTPVIGTPPREITLEESLKLLKSHLSASRKRSGDRLHLYSDDYNDYMESLLPKFSESNTLVAYRPTSSGGFILCDAFYKNNKGKLINVYAPIAKQASSGSKRDVQVPLTIGNNESVYKMEEDLCLAVCVRNSNIPKKFRQRILSELNKLRLTSEVAVNYLKFINGFSKGEKFIIPTTHKVIESYIDPKRNTQLRNEAMKVARESSTRRTLEESNRESVNAYVNRVSEEGYKNLHLEYVEQQASRVTELDTESSIVELLRKLMITTAIRDRARSLSDAKSLRLYVPCDLTYTMDGVVRGETDLTEKEAFKLLFKFDVYENVNFSESVDLVALNVNRVRDSVESKLNSTMDTVFSISDPNFSIAKTFLKEFCTKTQRLKWSDAVEIKNAEYEKEYKATLSDIASESSRLREELKLMRSRIEEAKLERKMKRKLLLKSARRGIELYKKSVIAEVSTYVATLEGVFKTQTVNTIKAQILKEQQAIENRNAKILQPYTERVSNLVSRRKYIKERLAELRQMKVIQKTVNVKVLTRTAYEDFIKPYLLGEDGKVVNTKAVQVLEFALKCLRKHYRLSTDSNMSLLTTCESTVKEERARIRDSKKRLEESGASKSTREKFEKSTASWKKKTLDPLLETVKEHKAKNAELLNIRTELTKQLNSVKEMQELGESINVGRSRSSRKQDIKPFKGIRLVAQDMIISTPTKDIHMSGKVQNKLQYLGFKF